MGVALSAKAAVVKLGRALVVGMMVMLRVGSGTKGRNSSIEGSLCLHAAIRAVISLLLNPPSALSITVIPTSSPMCAGLLRTMHLRPGGGLTLVTCIKRLWTLRSMVWLVAGLGTVVLSIARTTVTPNGKACNGKTPTGKAPSGKAPEWEGTNPCH